MKEEAQQSAVREADLPAIFAQTLAGRWVAHIQEVAHRLPREKQICPRSATNPGSQKIPTSCSAAPGRRLPVTVSPLPACPRTAALRLAICPSLSRVSPFTFVLTRAHLPAFHSHFLHKVQAVCFSIFFFESHFLLSFSLHKVQSLRFSKKFFESHFLLSCSPWNRLKSQVSKFPVPDDDGFKLFTSLVHCASHNTSSSTQIQERLEKCFYSIVDGFV